MQAIYCAALLPGRDQSFQRQPNRHRLKKKAHTKKIATFKIKRQKQIQQLLWLNYYSHINYLNWGLKYSATQRAIPRKKTIRWGAGFSKKSGWERYTILKTCFFFLVGVFLRAVLNYNFRSSDRYSLVLLSNLNPWILKKNKNQILYQK